MPPEPNFSSSDFGAQLNSCGAKVLGISFAYDDDARALATSMGAAELLDKVMLGQELLPAIIRLGSSESVSFQRDTSSQAIGANSDELE